MGSSQRRGGRGREARGWVGGGGVEGGRQRECNIPKVLVESEKSDYKCLLGSSEVNNNLKAN